MNLDININSMSIRISIIIFIIAVSINSSAQVNNATSLIELKAIKDTTLYGEFNYKSRNMVWRNKIKFYSDSIYRVKQKEEEKKNLLDFLSMIDSLYIFNSDNDTIHLFNHGDDFFMESNNYVVAKSSFYFSQDQRRITSDKDSLVCREKDTIAYRIYWLPQYMQNALKNDNLEFIAEMCKLYDKFDVRLLYSYQPRTNLIYYKIIIDNGKIVDRKMVEYAFDDFYGIFDDIYDTTEPLVADGKAFPLGEMNKFKANRGIIGRTLDSIYEHSYYKEILKKNPQILKWENDYVLSLVDSLNLINYDNDTVYYELCFNNKWIAQNRAGILTNSKRMFVYESFNNVVWDTLSGPYRDKYYGDENIDSYYHREMQSKYLFYIFSFKYPFNQVLYNSTYDWRQDYDFSKDLFKEIRPPRTNTIITPEMLNNKDILEDDFIRIITRIEFKDGNVVKAVTQMRIGEFYIWECTF